MDHTTKIIIATIATFFLPGVVYEIIRWRKKDYDGPSMYGIFSLLITAAFLLFLIFAGVVKFWDYLLS